MHNRREFSKFLALSVGGCVVSSGAALWSPEGQAEPMKLPEVLKTRVYNRGQPPQEFLEELIKWGRSSSDNIFEVNSKHDVYSHLKYKFGPWRNIRHRKAVMLEVLRVLGGFESSWNWNAGVDVGKTEPNTVCTEEAGIFQCSGNSIGFDSSLRTYMKNTVGDTKCATFITQTKANHEFAIGYCARLLRFTVKHHGPLNRKEHDPNNPRHSSIHPFLSVEAVNTFYDLLD